MTDETKSLAKTEAVSGELVTHDPAALALAGQVANQHAAAAVWSDYLIRKSANTLKRQARDLASFAEYLADGGVTADGQALQTDPAAWQGVTVGLVAGFKRWLLKRGYALATVNARLSTVRVYAGLAFDAGTIPEHEQVRIQRVSGYSQKESARVNEKRPVSRVGDKKGAPVTLAVEQARALKNQPLDTPQGRRDAVLMCLLIDHGLRVGELAGLQVGDVDMRDLAIRFHRPKVDKVQTHRLTLDTARALKAWFDSGDAPAVGPLLRASRKGKGQHGESAGQLDTPGMSVRAIAKRVRYLGEQVGVDGLSPHDCRHFWATIAARSGTDPFALKQAGGWASMATVGRYVDESKIANEGVKLDGTQITETR